VRGQKIKTGKQKSITKYKTLLYRKKSELRMNQTTFLKKIKKKIALEVDTMFHVIKETRYCSTNKAVQRKKR
jgi:hypothetical protein